MQIKYFFEKRHEYSLSDEHDHEKKVMKIFNVNKHFLVGIEIYTTFTRKTKGVRLPARIPVSEVVVQGQSTLEQLRGFSTNMYVTKPNMK